jgi:hypothetical protein
MQIQVFSLTDIHSPTPHGVPNFETFLAVNYQDFRLILRIWFGCRQKIVVASAVL